MKKRVKQRGQSTFELALLFPILFGLVFMVYRGFRAQHDASDRSISQHEKALELFNHGNSDGVVVDGTELIPPFDELGPAAHFDYPPWLNTARGLADLGLSKLFTKIFGDKTNVVTGYMKGYSESVSDQYIAAGMKADGIDYGAAQREGYVGSITSDQSTHAFKGDQLGHTTMRGDQPMYIHGDAVPNSIDFNAREFVGSGIQRGLEEYARSDFKDLGEFAGGTIEGMIYSDSAQYWFQSGNQLFKGAARGALAGAASGIHNGKLDWSSVEAGAARGAFYTERVARMVPFTNPNNPFSSASFQAANAVVGRYIDSGGKLNSKDILLTAATGAILSPQTQQMARGTSHGITAIVKAGVVDAALIGSATAIAHGDTEAIGNALYAASVSSAENYAVSQAFLRKKGSVETEKKEFTNQENVDAEADIAAKELRS